MEIQVRRRAMGISRKPSTSKNKSGATSLEKNLNSKALFSPLRVFKSPVRRSTKRPPMVAITDAGLRFSSAAKSTSGTGTNKIETSVADLVFGVKIKTEIKSPAPITYNLDSKLNEMCNLNSPRTVSTKFRNSPSVSKVFTETKVVTRCDVNESPDKCEKERNSSQKTNCSSDIFEFAVEDETEKTTSLPYKSKGRKSSDGTKEPVQTMNQVTKEKVTIHEKKNNSEKPLFFTRYLSSNATTIPLNDDNQSHLGEGQPRNVDSEHDERKSEKTGDLRIYNFDKRIPIAFIAMDDTHNDGETLVPVYRNPRKVKLEDASSVPNKSSDYNTDIILPAKLSLLSMKDAAKQGNKAKNNSGNVFKKKLGPNTKKNSTTSTAKSAKIKFKFGSSANKEKKDSENEFQDEDTPSNDRKKPRPAQKGKPKPTKQNAPKEDRHMENDFQGWSPQPNFQSSVKRSRIENVLTLPNKKPRFGR